MESESDRNTASRRINGVSDLLLTAMLPSAGFPSLPFGREGYPLMPSTALQVFGSRATWLTNGRAIERARPGPDPWTLSLDVRLERRTSDGPAKSGEVLTPLPQPLDLSRQPWRMSGSVRVPKSLVGAGPEEYLTPMRARWVMRDIRGRHCFGPNTGISLMPDQWIRISELLPTSDAPIPKGLMEDGFDLAQVSDVGLNIEAGNVPFGPDITAPPRMEYAGTIQLREMTLEPVPPLPVSPAALPRPYPARTDEAGAAGAIRARLQDRLALREGEMAVMVNLAWPMYAGRYHAYGTSLGLAPWGDHWGFSSASTNTWLRRDLRYLREHGIRVVRVFLFGDLRAGLIYNAHGRPVGFDPLVYRDMAALLAACREEGLLLVPSLLDFLVADDVRQEGPGLTWKVGERPELFLRPDFRAALVQLLAGFVQDFDGPEVLMWELMNEPENAVAMATPERFRALRIFLHEMALALHRQGVLTTIGSRHLGDAQRWWRGVVDVPQVHHWRLLESIQNPYAVDTPASVLGPLPAILGEVEPVAPEEVGPLLDRLRGAGYLMVGFWSLRGHDGYAYQPIAEAVQAWLKAQAATP